MQVGSSYIDVNTLASVMDDPAQAPHYLHSELAKSPVAAQAFIDRQGNKFVYKLNKGGVVFRRITWTSRNKKKLQKLKAGLSGSMNVGIQIEFGAEFEKNYNSTTEDVSIDIVTRAAGGNVNLLKGTNNYKEAMKQLGDWIESVRFDNATVISAGVRDVDRTLITTLRWTEHDIRAYKRNVSMAMQAYWDLALKQVRRTHHRAALAYTRILSCGPQQRASSSS